MPACDGRGFTKCSEPADQSDGRCIFHSEDPRKDRGPIERALERMSASGEFRCMGWVFPYHVGADGEEFKTADFRGATFSGGGSFCGATFVNDALFGSAIFGAYVEFDEATFQGDIVFEDTKFNASARFQRATFLGNTRFLVAKFGQYVSFTEAKFNGVAWFAGVSFAADVRFVTVSFRSHVRFDGASFSGDAWFRDMRITGVARFDNVRFRKAARFEGANFEQEARFDGATFVEDVVLNRTTFERAPTFRKTDFAGGVGLYEVRFNQLTTFDETQFGPSASFARSDLRLVTFRLCDMGGVALDEAYSVDEAAYVGCTWGEWFTVPDMPRYERSPVWLNRLFGLSATSPTIREETEARTSHQRTDFERAERVYREVRRSLENHKHFQEAHRFAFREMEMRRLSYCALPGGDWKPLKQAWGNFRSFWFSLEAWYLHLSGYGDSWLKPLGWLALAVLLVFPYLYAALGAVTVSPPAVGAPPPPPAGPLDFVAFSLSTASFLPGPAGVTQPSAVQLLQVVERILAPFLAVLFTLAVRRRFRR